MKHFFTSSARDRGGVQKLATTVLAVAVCAISIFSERLAWTVNAEYSLFDINEIITSSLCGGVTTNYWGDYNPGSGFENAGATAFVSCDVSVNGNVVYTGTHDGNLSDYSGSDTVRVYNIKSLVDVVQYAGPAEITGKISELDTAGSNFLRFTYTVYPITYNLNGGTITDAPTSYDYGTPRTLPTPTRPGYVFAGWTGSNGDIPQANVTIPLYQSGAKSYTANWTVKRDHVFAGWNTSADGTGTSYAPGDALPDANLDLYAQWADTAYDFAYTGAVQTFTAPVSGTYQLEVWGASSGQTLLTGKLKASSVSHGGCSYGNVALKKGDTVYVSVGGKGQDAIIGQAAGGWNGGGSGDWDRSSDELSNNASEATAGGGGATSMQLTLRGDGQLKNYETQKDTDVLIVAGGAGSTFAKDADYVAQDYATGGGESGSAGAYGPTSSSQQLAIPGTQTSGYAFGQGGSAEHEYANSELGAGGGGWYGGGAAIDTGDYTYVDGAGGSGHIGAMVTDGATVAGDQSFPAPDGSAEVGHAGNGYARITLIATD